jgi:PKD repeat protein
VRWDWDDNGTYDTTWSTTKIATHAFTTFGLFTIRLQVRDTGGLTDATIQQVEVTTTPQVFLPLISK